MLSHWPDCRTLLGSEPQAKAIDFFYIFSVTPVPAYIHPPPTHLAKPKCEQDSSVPCGSCCHDAQTTHAAAAVAAVLA